MMKFITMTSQLAFNGKSHNDSEISMLFKMENLNKRFLQRLKCKGNPFGTSGTIMAMLPLMGLYMENSFYVFFFFQFC